MTSPFSMSGFRNGLAIALAAALAGCLAGPDFKPPPDPVSTTYLPAAPASATETVALPVPWWSVFQSEELNRLVQEALAGNLSLAQARARLDQARETLTAQTGATLVPALDARLAASRQKTDPASMGITQIPAPPPYNLFNASVSISYTLDWNGKNRRLLEGLKSGVDYQSFQLQASRQSLAANVVNAAIRKAALDRQAALLRDMIALQSNQVAIAQDLHAAGGLSGQDLEQQRLLLAQTQALLPALERQSGHLARVVAVYLGREPATAPILSLELDALHLPPKLPLVLPSALVRQRPDIRAAESLWRQANANVGVATANLFPQFTLSAALGSQRSDIADIVDGMNIWNLGGNLVQPLFRGGELRARKRAALAACAEAAAFHRQTVLQGLQEVADTLQALDTDARTVSARKGVAAHAQNRYEIASRQQAAGGISRLALLDIRRQTLQTAMEQVQAQADQLTDVTALFHALGASW